MDNLLTEKLYSAFKNYFAFLPNFLMHQLMRQHLVNSLIPQAFGLLGSGVIAEKNLKTDSPWKKTKSNI